ncbi:MAG: PAS domain-containing protein [Deltaproteobacteria bacterium]|nr:PAS domain-containing protein [Deltaproteobacteria bacterium]
MILESISPRHWLVLIALVVCLMALGYWYRAGAAGVIIVLFILPVGTVAACAFRTLRESERREAEEKLRGSRYLLQTLVEGTSDAIYVKDPEGRYLLFNTAASRFTGKSPEAVIGKDDTFLFPTEEANAVMEGDRAVMDSGETRTYEEHVTTAGGEKATFLSTKGPLFDEHGNTTGLFGIARDITDRKRAEENYRTLFREMLDGFAQHEILCDEQGRAVDYRFLSVNPAFERLTGLKGEEIVGRTVLEVLPGIEPSWIETYGRVALTGEPAFFENYSGNLDRHYVVTAFRPAPRQFACIFSDITDRKRAEDRIRSETSLRNVLLDNMPCIALVLKKQTREIVACNEIAKSFGAVVGKTCHGSIPRQDPPCPFCRAPDLWDTGTNQQIEVEHLGKFWQGFWVPFSDDLYVHYIFDVTDRRRAEDEKEILRAQLQQAMKMEAVGRLAGGVAHDFNNLLTAIIGNVSLASMKVPPSDKVTDLLAEAKKAAERAARLTQQLLAFSRKQIIEPKVLDLNDLVADLEPMLARLIGENIELHTVPGGGLGPVKVDPGQFEQILVNMAVNARDAMPDGGKLLIETANVELDDGYCARHPGAQPGRFVMLAVSDTGHGMSEEVKKHIFEPFFTTKPKGSGTGLGLSMIYGTVLQAGGSIEVDSEEGRGTAFKIHLPRAEGEATRPAKDNGPPDLPGGSEAILLVEDEDVVRDLCVKLLDRLGYRVIQASSGEEAVLLAGNCGERVDLLMTDVVLPGMNGRELADRLVSLHPETKVLFTSGYTDDAIVRHGVLHDDVAFIGKPYSLPVLSKKIRQVLDR